MRIGSLMQASGLPMQNILKAAAHATGTPADGILQVFCAQHQVLSGPLVTAATLAKAQGARHCRNGSLGSYPLAADP